MDDKVKVLEEELLKARNAVKWQKARCHHLVSGLTVKLERREAQVKSLCDLRDTQLSQILCALLNLEARLRREQRSIRAQLGTRDAIIREQQLEIAGLKKQLEPRQTRFESPPESLQSGSGGSNDFEHRVKPDLISSIGIWNDSGKSSKRFLLPEKRDHSLSPLNGNSLTPSVSTDISESSVDTVIQAKQIKRTCSDSASGSHERDHAVRVNCEANEPIGFDRTDDRRGSNCVNAVGRSRPPSADMSIPESADSFTVIHDVSKIPEAITPPEEFNGSDVKRLPPSALLHEMQAQSKSGKNEYHDNPVLECVNQILLRDQEEFLEEQRVLRSKETDRAKSETQQSRRKSREDLTTVYGGRGLAKEKQPACPMTSTRLKPVDFEGLNGNEIFNKEPILRPPDAIKSPQQLKSASPPALPPKPLRLLDPKLRRENFADKKGKRQSSPRDVTINSHRFQLNLRPDIEIIGTSSPALPEPSSDSEFYVISNSALDDDTLQQIQGRNLKNSIELQKVLSPVESKRCCDEIDTHDSVHFPSAKKKENQDKAVVRSEKSCCAAQVIKVASPVSSLLAAVESVADDGRTSKADLSKSVLQIVQRFEHLGGAHTTNPAPGVDEDGDNALRKNFEEFRLDECDMDALCATTDEDGRAEADGAENHKKTKPAAVPLPSEAGVSYENFLEATGLSQKSIMTPTRIFSNHKHVLKPKDVKHRSRIKAAATVSNSTVRYWTEPFL